MKQSEIKIGEEYAVLPTEVGEPRYGNPDLVRARLVEVGVVLEEATKWKPKKTGHVLEVVGDQSVKTASWRRFKEATAFKDGARLTVASGRQIVGPWKEYEPHHEKARQEALEKMRWLEQVERERTLLGEALRDAGLVDAENGGIWPIHGKAGAEKPQFADTYGDEAMFRLNHTAVAKLLGVDLGSA